MSTLKYGQLTYELDHAVKGPDYIHGYDSNSNLVVAFDGIVDFEEFEYTGVYLAPEDCITEGCNTVKHVSGRLVRQDGTPISAEGMSFDGKLILSRDSYGSVLPATGEVGQVFFLKVKV